MSEKIIGRRFSHCYIARGEPTRDSSKARFRLAKLAEKSCPPPTSGRYGSSIDYNKIAQEKIENELGIPFGTRSTNGSIVRSWEWYFKRISLTEMLDTITIIAQSIDFKFIKDNKREIFVKEARRIFREENLAYQIDEVGGIHPLIDTTFSNTMESAISGLDDPRYTVSMHCINQIDECLLENPQDFIGAIRAVFGACENTFKLMYEVPRLDAKTLGERIGQDQQRFYEGHPTLQAVNAKMLEGFKQWVNAVHFYRHEQGVVEPNQPAPEVAILLISQGLSYVRWLVVLDRKKHLGS